MPAAADQPAQPGKGEWTACCGQIANARLSVEEIEALIQRLNQIGACASLPPVPCPLPPDRPAAATSLTPRLAPPQNTRSRWKGTKSAT